ncbi:hypothetical protein ACWKWP_03265 [Agromyces soli]
MPRWDDRPADEWIAEEFLHNAPRGRRLLAVDGADPARSARFADRLAAAIGADAVRRSVGAVDEATLRGETIEPFRSGTLAGAEGADTVLLVDGQCLFDDAVRGVWHFSVWTLAGDELPHSGASVIVDLSDEAAPVRYFYDYCAIPPSVNRAGLH